MGAGIDAHEDTQDSRYRLAHWGLATYSLLVQDNKNLGPKSESPRRERTDKLSARGYSTWLLFYCYIFANHTFNQVFASGAYLRN